jgi:hypothetical protein
MTVNHLLFFRDAEYQNQVLLNNILIPPHPQRPNLLQSSSMAIPNSEKIDSTFSQRMAKCQEESRPLHQFQM